ncbi:agmatine/peptidylarginine deiminase [Microbulbifer sp. CNSA002]|uniref:agmatine deiminase family protein n=1 Tax=unclassified Microbulbifer TaxID=2619833 RepID=UPI0039B64B35
MSNRLPPEWAKQDAIMLTWPHADTDWKPILSEVEAVYVSICEAITARQKLVVVCHDEVLKIHISQLLHGANVIIQNIQFVIVATNDSWARDHGPISVVNSQGEVVALDFTFNGWGSKYPADLDNQINQEMFKQLGICNWRKIDVVLEGGAIDIDEKGNLLTTERCLLNKNRNHRMTRADIEGLLKTELGAKNILWLDHGALEGDDTDSHIDTLARFAPGQTIVYQGCNESGYRFFDELEKMKQSLVQMRSLDGKPFNLLELPWPSGQANASGERLPATYANFLIINDAVLAPVYDVEEDTEALQTLQMAFPEHQIVAVNCRPIIEQFGSLHCLTMQLPKNLLAN